MIRHLGEEEDVHVPTACICTYLIDLPPRSSKEKKRKHPPTSHSHPHIPSPALLTFRAPARSWWCCINFKSPALPIFPRNLDPFKPIQALPDGWRGEKAKLTSSQVWTIQLLPKPIMGPSHSQRCDALSGSHDVTASWE